MGRHTRPALASKRRTSVLLAAAVIAPVAASIAAAADVRQLTVDREVETAAAAEPAYDLEVVAVPAAPSWAAPGEQASASVPANQTMWASRLRIVERNVQVLLPVGVAPERGLQVKTILTARSISAVFPEIQSIGGVRPDALRWHPDGLALDVMVPNPSSAEGIELGNQVVAYVLKHAKRLGIQDAIWRGVYYTPGGPRGFGAGHYDHVHITTTGGGYPTGSENYVR